MEGRARLPSSRAGTPGLSTSTRKLVLTYLNKIKHFVHAYGEWIKHVLAPLGPWGMLAFAAVVGSFIGLPLGAIFVGYALPHRSLFLVYLLLACAVSAL